MMSMALMTFTMSAKINGTVPDNMWNSHIIYTEMVGYGWQTIKSWLGSPEFTEVSVSAAGSTMQMKFDIAKDTTDKEGNPFRLVYFKLDLTFRFTGNGDCWCSKMILESATQGTKQTYICNNPYSDYEVREYGEMLGTIGQILQLGLY